MEDLDEWAKTRFGIPGLKPFQKEIIQKFLAPGPQSLLAVMPTGSGKTLCFTLPLVILPGLFLLIFPLKALMKDQLKRLHALGIPAGLLQGGQTRETRKRLWADLDNQKVKAVLTNPEVLSQPAIQRNLARYSWEAVVLDEAHCLPLWGESFRPAYLALGPVVRRMNIRVFSAFTATAPEDLRTRLGVHFFPVPPQVIAGDPDRENIFYLRWEAPSRLWALFEALKALPRPMILFCRTRDQTSHLATFIHRQFPSIPVKFFHAGLQEEEKQEIQTWFMDSPLGVLCATKAFGMGIDKKNIRTVIHWAPPDSLEDFLQESGRGGRDGQRCWSLILCSPKEAPPYLNSGVQQCYRKSLLGPLGWTGHGCSACGHCVPPLLPAVPWFFRPGVDFGHKRWTERELTLVFWGRKYPETAAKGLELTPAWGCARDYPLEILENLVTEGRKSGLISSPKGGFFSNLVVRNGQKP